MKFEASQSANQSAVTNVCGAWCVDVLWVHGYMTRFTGSKYEGLQCYLSQALSQGFAVVTPEYRLGERGYRGRDMVSDVMDVVRWVRDYGPSKHLDPE